MQVSAAIEKYVDMDEVQKKEHDDKQKRINKQIKEQTQYLYEMLEKTDPWLLTAYNPVFSKLNTILLMQRFNETDLEYLRESLHLADSSISNMLEHGVEEKDAIDDAKLFCYLYSIHDMLVMFVYDGTLIDPSEVRKYIKENEENHDD